jgi:hypothetical protein
MRSEGLGKLTKSFFSRVSSALVAGGTSVKRGIAAPPRPAQKSGGITRGRFCWQFYTSQMRTDKERGSVPNRYQHLKQTPWPLVRERNIPTEQPPLVDEI